MAEENKVPKTTGIEYRGGKQIPHVKPSSNPQNQTGNSNNAGNNNNTKK